MDLYFHGPEPTAAERAAVDAVLGPPSSAWSGGQPDLTGDGRPAFTSHHSVPTRRDLFLPTLHAIQNRFGWLTPGALDYACRRLQIPPAEAYGVATFYHLFSTSHAPLSVAHVCDDIVCRVRGGLELCAQLEAALGPESQGSWKHSPCLGLCERPPAALVCNAGEKPSAIALAEATPAAIAAARHPHSQPSDDWRSLARSIPQIGHPGLRLLARAGRVDPTSLDAFLSSGGYQGLVRALELGPEAVIRQVLESNLMGRGGAAFPTGRKWDAVFRQPAQPHYVVCNADESEPGTFKDRVLMEGDPFAVIEGMTIAGVATGSKQGYLYVRGEYPLAARRLCHAIEQARQAGFLGPNLRGSGFDFEIELRRGAGAYICGEETALFNSIEGKRGEPRNKPPFPVQAGLFGKPTAVNNVETLVNIPLILSVGAAAYRQIGTQGSSGPKLFCVSGRVERPGLYELPFGHSLGELIERAGGVAGGKPLHAILLGGAAGVFVGPEALGMPLSFEATREAGATLGSGVVLVLDKTVDLGDILARIAAFFRDESCGQCVPCRVGSVRQQELLTRLRSGQTIATTADEMTLLKEIAQAMRDASICGLGQTASSAIESALATLNPFPDREPDR